MAKAIQQLTSPLLISPGARVEIRNEEWLVRRVDHLGEGQALHVSGVSELTRNKDAIFLTALESEIRLLKAEETKLIPDPSYGYQQSKLYLESQLRQMIPPQSEKPKLYIGHRAAMDVVPYQLTPALQALEQPRQRILIADAVGLGKTLECGILLSELILRGQGKRMLVLATKSLLTQFQKEMWSRFSIPLVRLDSNGIQRLRRDIPTNHNPFDYYDKTIISMDTLKQDTEYRRYLEQSWWDIIVIDEAHNVAERGAHSLRAKLAKLLASRSDTLIMLSATPHDGRAKSFASLMNMLNPTAIANPEHYSKDEIQGLFVRRFKKDIKDQVQNDFQERSIHELHIQASPLEEEAYQALSGLRFEHLQDKRSGGMLIKTGLEKALFSSPAACLQTLRNRIQTLEKSEALDYSQDIEALTALQAKVAAIGPEHFSKYLRLLSLLNKELKWKKNDPQDRVVIFTERIETLKFLQAHLPEALKLKENQLDILHGGLADTEQQAVVENFGKERSPVRLLIASDVASEGINLHYLSHRMIHFDIPWSLMVFQQRNGRIDRYGQSQKPEIYYLMTDSHDEKIRGDQRVLTLLIEKDQQAVENIGDPSALLGKYSIEGEEALIAEVIESGQGSEGLEKTLKNEAAQISFEDFLADFEVSAVAQPEAQTGQMPSLYANTLSYVRAALDQLGLNDYTAYENGQALDLRSLPEDLLARFETCPSEIYPDNGLLKFSTQVETIQREIEICRKEEKAWPQVHYLWEQHPLMGWLNDKVNASFGRHQAPVVCLDTRLNGMVPGEEIYLLSGLYPNLKGHPLIWQWLGVRFEAGRFVETLPFEALLERCLFGSRDFPNPGLDLDLPALQNRLPEAVKQAKNWLLIQKMQFENRMQEKLAQELKALETLKGRKLEQLELNFAEAVGVRLHMKDKERRSIDTVFSDYQVWVQETLTVHEQPYIQVQAVFVGE